MSTPIHLVAPKSPISRAVSGRLVASGFDVRMPERPLGGAASHHADRPGVVLYIAGIEAGAPEEYVSLRERYRAPVCVLLVAPRPGDLARSLDEGADMVIPLPCDTPELAARLKALSRRFDVGGSDCESDALSIGDLTVHFSRGVVEKRGIRLDLSPIEFRFLSVLARNRDAVVPHRRILTEVWGEEYQQETQYLRIYARSIREKIEDNPEEPQYLLTDWGIGYRMSHRTPIDLRGSLSA